MVRRHRTFPGSAGLARRAQDAPLGDLARQARKQKGQQAPAVKKYDNDNLPVNDKLSVVGQAPAETADASAPATDGEPAPAAGDKPPQLPASGLRLTNGKRRRTSQADDKKPRRRAGAEAEIVQGVAGKEFTSSRARSTC